MGHPEPSHQPGTLTVAVSLLLYIRGEVPAEERRQSVGALAVGLIALLVAGMSYELWRLGMPVHVHLVWWSVAAALTMVAGHAWRSYTVRVVGHLLNGAVAIWMAVLYSLRPEPVWLQTSAPVLNEVCLAYLVGLLSLAVTLLAYRRGEHLEPAERAVPGTIAPVLALLVVWGGASELSRLHMPSHVHLAWLALASGLLMAMGHGRRSKSLRTTALVLQGILAGWLLFLYSLDAQPLWLPGHQPLLNETFLAFLLGLGSLAVTAALYGQSELKSADATLARRAIPLALAVLGLWGLTADVSRGLGELAREHLGLRSIRGFGISLLWCIYAAGLVWYSLVRRRVEVRLIGVIVFGLAVFKVFLVDTWQLEAVWKALSYACLAGILLGVSYL